MRRGCQFVIAWQLLVSERCRAPLDSVTAAAKHCDYIRRCRTYKYTNNTHADIQQSGTWSDKIAVLRHWRTKQRRLLLLLLLPNRRQLSFLSNGGITTASSTCSVLYLCFAVHYIACRLFAYPTRPARSACSSMATPSLGADWCRWIESKLKANFYIKI